MVLNIIRVITEAKLSKSKGRRGKYGRSRFLSPAK